MYNGGLCKVQRVVALVELLQLRILFVCTQNGDFSDSNNMDPCDMKHGLIEWTPRRKYTIAI